MRRAVLMQLCMAWLAAAGLGCFSPSEPRVGGESHWLAECSHDGECGDALSCVCGTCTRACSKDEACAGNIDAACYDPSSPLLLKRCEDRGSAESHGICLPHCLQAQDCGETRTCMQGTCVPRTSRDAPASDASVDAPVDLGEVSWSEPVQVPVPQTTIAGGSDDIVGVWRQTNCGDVNVPGMELCLVRLEIERSAEGTITGRVFYEGSENAPDPFAPASDPEVGYPPGLTPSQYGDVFSGSLQVNTSYRMLDGHFASGHLTFEWTRFDPWHDWCRLQTPYPWHVGDRLFYYCVPQDEDARATFDHGKIALCTSADFLKLCTDPKGNLIPCVCAETGTQPAPTKYLDERYDPALCSPAFCHCDEQGCDASNSATAEDLVVTGTQMMGFWNDTAATGPRQVVLERSQP